MPESATPADGCGPNEGQVSRTQRHRPCGDGKKQFIRDLDLALDGNFRFKLRLGLPSLFRALSLCGFLLFNPFLFGSSCGGLFGFSFVSVVTESLLNLLGKLSEVNFRDSGLVYQHNAIWFDTAYLGVLVFAPFDGFEVLGECEGRGQCKLIVQFSSTSRRGRDSALLLSTRQRQSDINVRGTQAM